MPDERTSDSKQIYVFLSHDHILNTEDTTQLNLKVIILFISLGISMDSFAGRNVQDVLSGSLTLLNR